MVQQIDAERTRELAQDDSVVLIDVLGPQSYNEHHLPGAVNIPVKHPDFEREMQEAIPSKDSPVIVYCANTECQASPTAAARLEDMGYNNVFDFEAGLQGWEEAGFSFEGERASQTASDQSERKGGDRKEQAQRNDEARDPGGRAATRQEAQDRKGQEKEIAQRSDTKRTSKDARSRPAETDAGDVEIDDMETHMQAE